MKTENKEMWDSFNAFEIRDIKSSKEEKIYRMIEWRQEKVTKWRRRSMKRWEKEGRLDSHLQEDQMWNFSILQRHGYGVRAMADISMSPIITNFVYLSLSFRIIHLVLMRNFQKNKVSYPCYGHAQLGQKILVFRKILLSF